MSACTMPRSARSSTTWSPSASSSQRRETTGRSPRRRAALRSSEQQKDRGALAWRLARAAPLGDRARTDALRAKRQIGGDAKARARCAGLQQRAEQRLVPVGGLDEDLGLALTS